MEQPSNEAGGLVPSQQMLQHPLSGIELSGAEMPNLCCVEQLSDAEVQSKYLQSMSTSYKRRRREVVIPESQEH